MPRHRVVAREAVEHRALRRADPLEGLEHGVVRVAVVDLHRDPVLLRERDVRLEALELRRACRPRRCGRSPGPSRRSPARAAARRARRSRRSPRRAARPPAYAGASFGWIATAASTRGWDAAAHADHTLDSMSPPACTTPITPTAAGALELLVERQAARRRPRSRGARGCRTPAPRAARARPGQRDVALPVVVRASRIVRRSHGSVTGSGPSVTPTARRAGTAAPGR